MKFLISLGASLALVFSAVAADVEPTAEQKAAFEHAMKIVSKLKFQEGVVPLAGGKVNITLAKDFRYLNPDDTRKVLGELWENPDSAAASTDGMIVPADIDFFAENSWAAIVKWKQEGYIKDEEFASTDFNKMLEELKDGSKEASKERVRQGFGKMELDRWAEPPHYDKGTHKLYWAKAYNTDHPEQGLNYDIRVLGRAGVLEVSIISSMPHLKEIQAKSPTILSMVDFTQGNRYADYKPGDHTAAYGIAGLIAGGVLLKTGFFKGLLVLLAKFAKPLIVAVAAIGVWLKKLFTGGRRKQI